MGVSRIPDTAAAMDGLESLMREPVPAGGARACRVSDYLDSDTLADMAHGAAEAGPSTDLRPLVAMELDEIVNWTRAAGWDPAVLGRAREMVVRHRDDDVAAHVDGLVMPDTPEAAVALVAAIQGIDPDAAAGRLGARRGFAPGTFAVIDSDTGESFRVEAVYGVVVVGPPGMTARIEAELAPPATGPAP